MNYASYAFPAVCGIQAGKRYYTAMVPLEVIPVIFQTTNAELPPEIRSQRALNEKRVPQIRDYMVENPDTYVFSSLTASVDGNMEFKAIDENNPLVGYILISLSARFLINDGQHRCAGIIEALKSRPELKNETISVVFFHDEGLARSQQMFSDLNRYALHPSKSINVLYSSRDELSVITKNVVDRVDAFNGLTEKEKVTVSNRSKALFTLSAIHAATAELLKGITLPAEERQQLAVDFWETVSQHMPDWTDVKRGDKKSSEVREHSICSLSIALAAIGYSGNKLLRSFPDDWKKYLDRLDNINWRKDNEDWKDLIYTNGRVAANRTSQKALSLYVEEILMKEEMKV